MQHIRPEQLKTCIAMDSSEFNNVLHTIFGDNIETEYSMDGLYIGYRDGDGIEDEELHKKLAEYFDVKTVTSIHIDDCEYLLVWTVYKN